MVRECSSSRRAQLPVLQHAVKHGEDDLLLGLAQAAEALELGGGPACAGAGVGDAEQHVGGHIEEGQRAR